MEKALPIFCPGDLSTGESRAWKSPTILGVCVDLLSSANMFFYGIQIVFPLYVICAFSLAAFNIFSSAQLTVF